MIILKTKYIYVLDFRLNDMKILCRGFNGNAERKITSECGRFGGYRQGLIGFEALYDGRMKGMNTTTFRPLITPFEAVVKVERKNSFLSQFDLPYISLQNFVTFYDQKKVAHSTFGGRG